MNLPTEVIATNVRREDLELSVYLLREFKQEIHVETSITLLLGIITRDLGDFIYTKMYLKRLASRMAIAFILFI